MCNRKKAKQMSLVFRRKNVATENYKGEYMTKEDFCIYETKDILKTLFIFFFLFRGIKDMLEHFALIDA